MSKPDLPLDPQTRAEIIVDRIDPGDVSEQHRQTLVETVAEDLAAADNQATPTDPLEVERRR